MPEPEPPAHGANAPPKLPAAKKRRFPWLPRFGLLTLVSAVMLIGSVTTVWWRWAPWELAATMRGHSDRVDFVSFSSDGERVISVSRFDGTTRIWNAQTGEQLLVRRNHTAVTQQFAVSPNGPILAAVGEDEIKPPPEPWVAELKKKLAVPVSFDFVEKPFVECVEFFKATVKAKSGFTPPIKLSPGVIRSGASEIPITLHVTDMKFETALSWLVRLSEIDFQFIENSIVICTTSETAQRESAEGCVRIWDLEGGTLRTVLPGHEKPIQWLELSSDGRWMFTCCATDESYQTLRWRLWQATTGRLRQSADIDRAKEQFDGINHVAFSENGERFVVGIRGDAHYLDIWDADLKVRLHRVKTATQVQALAMSPDGTRVASVLYSSPTVLWGADSGRCIAEMHRSVITAAFSKDSSFVALPAFNDSQVLNAKTGKALATLQVLAGIRRIQFFSDNRRLIEASGYGSVAVWDCRDGSLLAKLPSDPPWKPIRDFLWPPTFGAGAGPLYEPTALEPHLSPDEMQIVAGGVENELRVFSRRRPEYWWGVAWLPEFWLGTAALAALVYSVRRDWRDFRRKPSNANLPPQPASAQGTGT